ncbi:MAG: hypothetical protein WC742_07520 [Gallionellaceae bacterium]
MLIPKIISLMLLLAFSSIASAKDVSALQAGVEYARQEVEKADTQNQLDQKNAEESAKLLEERRKAFELQTKQLAEDRKKAELSQKLLLEANTKYHKAQARLDQAWKE